MIITNLSLCIKTGPVDIFLVPGGCGHPASVGPASKIKERRQSYWQLRFLPWVGSIILLDNMNVGLSFTLEHKGLNCSDRKSLALWCSIFLGCSIMAVGTCYKQHVPSLQICNICIQKGCIL
jgi:hypothetical protein